MIRLAAAALLAVVVAFPVAVRPTGPVTWLAILALAVGGLGVIVLAVSLVTAAGALALIGYALALVLARPAVDPVAATGFGAALVLLLALVHFAARVHGAALGPAVVAVQVRQWLAVVAAGVVAAGGLTAGGALLGSGLVRATLPTVVVAATLGALLVVAGVIALTTWEDPPTHS
jgi:hypothetical protein